MIGVSGGSKVTFRNFNADTGLKPFILWPADYGTAPAPSWARVDSRDSALATVTVEHFLDWIRPRCGFEEHCPGLEQGCRDGGIVARPPMPAVLGAVRRPAERRGVEVVLGWLLALTSAPASRSQAGEGVAVWWAGRFFVLRTRRGSNKKAPLARRTRPGAALVRPLRPFASRGKSVAQFSNTRMHGSRGRWTRGQLQVMLVEKPAM